MWKNERKSSSHEIDTFTNLFPFRIKQISKLRVITHVEDEHLRRMEVKRYMVDCMFSYLQTFHCKTFTLPMLLWKLSDTRDTHSTIKCSMVLSRPLTFRLNAIYIHCTRNANKISVDSINFSHFFFFYTRQKVNKTIRWISCLILIFIWCAGGFYRYLQTPVKLTVARCSVWNCRLNNRTANSHHANSIFSITKHDRNIYCDCASRLCKFQSNFESETCERKCNVAAF